MTDKPELEFHAPDAPWRQPDGAAEGIWEQTLTEDSDGANVTLLQRYEPGVDTTAHGVLTHTFWEEVFLVGGDLRDLTLGTTFEAGMYACRPPGMPHGPYRSDNGCTMIVNCRRA